jgi:hypothetical protein
VYRHALYVVGIDVVDAFGGYCGSKPVTVIVTIKRIVISALLIRDVEFLVHIAITAQGIFVAQLLPIMPYAVGQELLKGLLMYWAFP